MPEPQQFYLFPPADKPSKKPKKSKVVFMVPESQEIDRLKDLVERYRDASIDLIVLASQSVTSSYWSKYLKRVNLNLEQYDLPKILFRKGDFVWTKGRPATYQHESEIQDLNLGKE